MPGEGRFGRRERALARPARQLGLWENPGAEGSLAAANAVATSSIPAAVSPASAASATPDSRAPVLTVRPERSGQFPLFEDRVQALGDLESAFDDADCDGVTGAVLRLRAGYGADAVPGEIRDWLPSALPPGFWQQRQPLPERLAALARTVAALTALAPGRVGRFRDGFLLRLLQEHRAQELAHQAPELLVPLFVLLHRRGRGDESRRLVLDALLAGRELNSLDFDRSGDAAIADLLAGNRSAVWLACEGVVRGLWHPGRLDPTAVAALAADIDGPLPRRDDDAGRARVFWSCLVAWWNRALLSDLLETRARIRMKKLDAELHALLFV